VHAGIVNIESVATEKSLGTEGAGVGEEAGKVDALHMVSGEAAPGSLEDVAEPAEEGLVVAGVWVLSHILPQVLVRGVG
jgi:hypothetical protein